MQFQILSNGIELLRPNISGAGKLHVQKGTLEFPELD